jgi:ribosome-associated toxin RatA of RatAB toxin-antitoxin module
MRIVQHTDIDVSADQVWQIVGHEFTDIGRWASAIPTSAPTSTGDGRECRVPGVPGIDRVTERLVAYDDDTRTLTYVADSGMPRFVRKAVNTWRVQPLSESRARVAVSAEVEVAGSARLLLPLLRLSLAFVGRRTLGELKHYVEHGRPAPRKQRQLSRRTRHDSADGARHRGVGRPHATSPFTLEVQRDVAALVAAVWDAVSDAAGYAHFAPGIATTVVSGRGHDMVRVCTDDHGFQWSERCSLWEPGRRYRMSVDVSSYPLRYRMLFAELHQTWHVEPIARGSRVTLTFHGAVKLGVLGRLAVRMLGRGRQLESILDAYEVELATQAQPAGDLRADRPSTMHCVANTAGQARRAPSNRMRAFVARCFGPACRWSRRGRSC